MKVKLALLVLNIVLCITLLGDSLILDKKGKAVLIKEKGSREAKTESYDLAVRYHHIDYCIYTSDNCRYDVDYFLHESLHENDSIRIFTSLVFNMPAAIQFSKNGQTHVSKIGLLNSNRSFRMGLGISLALSVITLIAGLVKPFKYPSPALALMVIALGISFTVVSFVLFQIFLTYG